MATLAEITIGAEFHRWTVIGIPYIRGTTRSNKQNYVLCRCQCGTEREVKTFRLGKPISTSCGCHREEITSKRRRTHGQCRTRLYGVWCSLKSRCYNEADQRYYCYGARGINVCDEWVNSFENFREWALSHGYNEDLTIDRENNDGNYEPSNCRWIPGFDQGSNKRNNKQITAFGETKTLAQWSRDDRCVVDYQTLGYRIRSGVAPEVALATPTIAGGKNQFR